MLIELKKLLIYVFCIYFITYFTFLTLHWVHADSVWKISTALPYNLASHTSALLNNRILIIDGSADFQSSRHTVLSNTNNENGSLSAWNNEFIDTPSALIWHVSTINNNFLYILGGKEENLGSAMSHVNKVYVGKINNGLISNWVTVTDLPQALSLGTAFILNDKLYYLGGFREENGNIYSNKIYRSDISDADGSLGTWTEIGVLPEALSSFGMFADGNNILIIGGGNSSGKKSNVYRAVVDSNGDIGAWSATHALPKPLSHAQFAKSGSKIIVVGGVDANGTTLDDVFYTDINADGTVNPWKTSGSKIPQPTCCGTLSAINNYLYLIGGHNTNTGEYFDDVYYTKLDDLILTSLDVPYFSQNDNPWGPSEYDHTLALGVSNNNGSMDRWGCAVTSIAMLLSYHGLTELVDGTPLDPGSLNNWLKNNNGYSYGSSSAGWYSGIIWGRINGLSRELFDIGKSDIKLEHTRAYPSNTTTNQLHDDLTNGNNISKFPSLLHVKNPQTNGHFVVAKGVNGSNYSINDPEWDYPDLSYYSISATDSANIEYRYDQVDRYVPSNSDLSYIQIDINSGVDILVTDLNGKKTGILNVNGIKQSYDEIPGAYYSLQSPISNPATNQILQSLGSPYHQFILPKPASDDQYLVLLSSSAVSDYIMNIAVAENDGDSQLVKISGVIGPIMQESLNLKYFKNQNSAIHKNVSFSSIIDDLNELQKFKLITEKSLVKSLIQLIKQTEKNANRGKMESVEKKLKQFEKIIKEERGDDLSKFAYQILIDDLTYLRKLL